MPYFSTSDNCNLYYEVRGTGKPVVFVHGWDCNHHFFKYQVEDFRNDYQVISYDLRGHGDSDRPEKGLYLERFGQDLKELIDYLGLEKVVLIGWSMGVDVVWEYIDQFGCDNVDKVVLIDMTAKVLAEEEDNWPYAVFGGFNRVDSLNQMDSIARDWKAVADGFVPTMFADGPHQELIPWILEEAYKNSEHVMINMWLAMTQKGDYRYMLNKVTVPALVTYGTHKSLYSKESAEWLAENMPNARAAGFDGGHIHFMQDTENFNKTVKAFIDE